MENSQQLSQQLAEYDTRRRSSVDVLNEAMGKYGVPELRGRVSGLRTTLTNTENALNAVDPSVTGRTSGSLVTEAQRTKQVANERAPIAEQYGTFARSLDNASSDLNSQERAAQLLAESQLRDYETGRNALAGRYQLATERENEQRRREETDRTYQLSQQEAARQAAATSSGYNLSGLSGGPKSTAQMQQRSGGGFNFQDPGGRSISAAQYAQIKGIPLRALLQQMANAGDTGAKTALDFVGDDFGVNKKKLSSAPYDANKIRSVLNSILWGVNSV